MPDEIDKQVGFTAPLKKVTLLVLMTTAASKRGNSLALAKDSFYGLPWNQAVYQAHVRK